MKKIIAFMLALVFIVSSFTVAIADPAAGAVAGGVAAQNSFRSCVFQGCTAAAVVEYDDWHMDNVWTGNGYVVQESRNYCIRCAAGHIYRGTDTR